MAEDILVDEDEELSEDLGESSPKRFKESKKSKYSGAFKYKTKFSKEWTKTWPFISAVPGDSYSARCNVCAKTWALPTRELLTYAVMFDHKHTASWQKLLQHCQSFHLCHQTHLLTRYVTNSATFLYFLIDMIWNCLQITRAEVKVATLLVHSNVSFSVADQLSPLFKKYFQILE